MRDPATRAAAVIGVTSHGPDCLQGPSYNWGFYTGACVVRQPWWAEAQEGSARAAP